MAQAPGLYEVLHGETHVWADALALADGVMVDVEHSAGVVGVWCVSGVDISLHG